MDTRDMQATVLGFDGHGYIDLGTETAHEVRGGLTIETWAWVDRQAKWAGLVSKIFDTGDTESGYGLLLDGASGVYFGLKTTAGPMVYLSSGAGTIAPSTWHHIACSYDGATMRIVIDGTERASQPISGAIDYDPRHFMRIGRYQDDNEVYGFAGKLGEVRLWSVARTPAQIAAGLGGRLKGDEAGLAGWWPLDDGAGEVAADRSPSAVRCAIVGARWLVDAAPPAALAVPRGPTEAETLRATIAEKDARIAALEAQLAGCAACKDDLAARDAEITKLRAELASRPAPAPKVDRMGEIEGIGPKTSQVLAAAGITSYEALAATSVERLGEILRAAGKAYAMANPSSWPEQARLAAAGDWAGLAALQASLNSGR